MAKPSKKNQNAPAFVPPVPENEISLDTVARLSAVDPFFAYVPVDRADAWEAEGLIETNRTLVDESGAIASRITEKGKQSLMNTPVTETAPAAASTPATDSGFIRRMIPAVVAKRNTINNAAKYPFDDLVAPVTDENGNITNDAFFVPATADRPNPAKSLASTVSTAKDRYSRKVGERPYKAKDENGNEITKTRAIKEYDREFRIEAGEATDANGNTVKGAWVARTK